MRPKPTRRVSEIRSPHYLRRSSAVGMPRLSVALSVVCDSAEVQAPQRHREYKLRRWTGFAWGAAAPQTDGYCCESGGDAASCWRWLLSLASGGACAWVWQLGAGAGCTALGLWEMLESGQLRLSGYDGSTGKRLDGKEGAAWRGQCLVSDPPFAVLCKPANGAGSLRLLCVRNLGVDSWQEIADSVGDVRGHMGRYGHASGSAVVSSLMRATQLFAWLSSWYATVDGMRLGGLRQTAGAQAWHGWRRGYMGSLCLVHANDEAIQLERSSLYAGRNECYRLGRIDGPVYEMDAHSYYPGIATGAKLPCRLKGVGRIDDADAGDMARCGWLLIAECDVETNVPCMPYRYGDITMYPTGAWRAAYCWPEIAYARERGATVSVKRAAWYEPGSPFDKFFAALQSARRASESRGDRAAASAHKLIANSLIGKCAQWNWAWVDRPDVPTSAPWRLWYGLDPLVCPAELLAAYRARADGAGPWMPGDALTRWRSVGWHVQVEQCIGETAESMPALAAWVYSLARVRLARWMHIAGPENVHYADSDSVWCNEEGYRRLLSADSHMGLGAGMLSLRRAHDWAEFCGLKYYNSPHGLVCSGVSDCAVMRTDGGYEYWTPERITDSLRVSHKPRAVLKYYYVGCERRYRHGRVNPDGTVSPHSIMEGNTGE